MTTRIKVWTCIINLSILILLPLFSQSLVNYQPILSSSGMQNQKLHFFESFEELSSTDLMSGDFDFMVTGEVPYGITSEFAHNGSNSLFVGPSTCNSFCFDDFSVIITVTSIDLTNDEYAISYWRRESFDFGGAIRILIDGIEVYDEDADDGVFNTGEDTGWYRRFFFYTGSINSLTFWETDLTNSNTIFLDDIIIQNAIDIDPSTMITTETEQPTEQSTDLPTVTTSIMITSEIDQSTEQPTVTAKITDNSPPRNPSFDLGLLKNSIALGFLFGVTVLIIVVSLKTPMPKS